MSKYLRVFAVVIALGALIQTVATNPKHETSRSKEKQAEPRTATEPGI